MRDIQHILCPIDFSEASQHAIDHAAVIARWYHASITALHVYNPIFFPAPSPATPLYAGPYEGQVVPDDAEALRLQDEVARCFQSATAAGVSVHVLIASGAPPAQILDRAASIPADLIVIGTHGHGGFEHLVLGSVTEKVLRKATCPVLTVPPRARATSKLPFKRLLCPTDFSESSLAALEFAFSLAQEGDAELTILHVLEWPTDDGVPTTRAFRVTDDRQERERDAVARLQELVPASVREWCRPATRIGHGKPYRQILGVAAEDSADLIVMGVHGRSALDLMLFGSTTNQVVRRATCPILTIRQEWGA